MEEEYDLLSSKEKKELLSKVNKLKKKEHLQIFKIIQDTDISYSENSNGIFINLNFLDNDILDMIYYVVNDYKKEINMNDVNDNINYISIPSITYSDSFTKQAENIEYNDVDNFVLDLSTRVLTI